MCYAVFHFVVCHVHLSMLVHVVLCQFFFFTSCLVFLLLLLTLFSESSPVGHCQLYVFFPFRWCHVLYMYNFVRLPDYPLRVKVCNTVFFPCHVCRLSRVKVYLTL